MLELIVKDKVDMSQ